MTKQNSGLGWLLVGVTGLVGAGLAILARKPTPPPGPTTVFRNATFSAR